MTFTISMTSVEAKRLGGGSSFGKQSFNANHQAHNFASRNSNMVHNQGLPAKQNSWKGILGGALLGLGLGALLSHFGLGGAMASIISTVCMIVLLAFCIMCIYRFFRRKVDHNTAHPNYVNMHDINSQMNSSEQINPINNRFSGIESTRNMNAPDVSSYNIPNDFDKINFIRNAKTYFIRLQAAWDKADIQDICEFTTPEMFSELKLQLQERGSSTNFTDVVSLDADMLGVEKVGKDYLASVKFYGFIREHEHASPTQFREIWNLSKPINGSSGWVLAGIQQLSE